MDITSVIPTRCEKEASVTKVSEAEVSWEAWFEIVVNKLELKFMNRDADLTNEDVALYLLSCTWSRKLNNVKYFDTKDPELLSRYSFLFSGAKSVYILGRWEALPIESILGES